jgi:hypothetical protein
MKQLARAAMLGALCVSAHVAAAPPVALAGRWVLNREQSEFPKEVAFGIEGTGSDSSQGGGQAGAQGGGRRGGGRTKGGGGGFNMAAARESEEDAQKITELIAEAKNPSDVLVIAQTDLSVSITDTQDRTRVFHPNSKQDVIELQAGPTEATTKWTGSQLSVQLTIRSDRIFRYLYSRLPGGQLAVETRLEEGRSHDKPEVIRRVYDQR